MTARLPASLMPYQTDSLIRMGRDHDGGYVLDERSIMNAEALISFGINDDWSFEEDFRARNEAPVYAYDGKVSTGYFGAMLVKCFSSPSKLRNIPHWLRTIREYRQFFRGDVRHIQKYVGETDTDHFASLPGILASHLPQSDSKFFLKIDIEGWEYRILEDILNIAHRLTGLAMEFHDVDLHLDKITSFVERLPLSVCHIHANNYSPIGRTGCPYVIEMSFTSQPISDVPASLPSVLDMVNNRHADEIAFEFA
jgi:hypothetical protein